MKPFIPLRILRFPCILASFFLLVGLGCAPDSPPEKLTVRTPQDLNQPGYTIGVPVGAAASYLAEKQFPKATIKQYGNLSDGYAAVEYKKIDAFIFDRHPMEYAVKNTPGLALLPDSLGEEHIVIGLPKKKTELRNQINRFIATYRNDGTYKDMYNRWFSKNPPPMPDVPKPGNPAKKLVFGTNALNQPVSFRGENGKLTGFDIEFIYRLAAALNAEAEIIDMPFDALIAAAEAGRIDALVANLNKRDKLSEIMLLTDDYIDSDISMMIHSDRLPPSEKTAKPATSLDDLEGKCISFETGSVFETIVRQRIKNPKLLAFNDIFSSVQAVATGKADATLMDEPLAARFAAKQPDILQITGFLESDPYAFALPKNSPLINDVNRIIKAMKDAGELDALKEKWCNATSDDIELTDWKKNIPFTGKNGTLRYFGSTDMDPMCYINRHGEPVGLEFDILNRIACELDRKLEVSPLPVTALIEALVSGKADIIGGTLSVTPERCEKVDFAESHYLGGMVILTRKPEDPNAPQKARSFPEWLKETVTSFNTSFNRTFIRESRWKLVLDGLALTILITLLAAFFGTILAFALCALYLAKNKSLAAAAKTYIAVMQGTPILVILMILYYIVFADINLHGIVVAIIAFALNFAAYAGEILRTGIQAVPKGQREAALALGFSKITAFRKVILPQVLRQILPLYRAEFVSTLKMTSVVGYIAIQDLTKISDIIRSRTYEAFFPLIATALIYFVTAHILALAITALEHRLDPKLRRKAARKGETR